MDGNTLDDVFINHRVAYMCFQVFLFFFSLSFLRLSSLQVETICSVELFTNCCSFSTGEHAEAPITDFDEIWHKCVVFEQIFDFFFTKILSNIDTRLHFRRSSTLKGWKLPSNLGSSYIVKYIKNCSWNWWRIFIWCIQFRSKTHFFQRYT